MSDPAPATPAGPPDPTTNAPRESRVARLLALVRKLIDYSRDLAGALQQRGSTAIPHQFGTADIALILARITQGLHRAQVLEDRLNRNAARLDAPHPSRRAVSKPRARISQPGAPNSDVADATPAQPPTPEQIAAWVRRQPIGAVLADICLGILPSHPLWPEISDLIRRHGGNLPKLLKEIIAETGRRVAQAWIAAGLPPGPLPATPTESSGLTRGPTPALNQPRITPARSACN
ncbi:MAG TPA: hypothetical protein VHY82_11215 [Acetobacteraceae bacterium]|nr:hypothetical protein [Acetobacteraceae bacterium]